MRTIKERTCTPEEVKKPCCYGLECPYGALVEDFPLHAEFEGQDLNELAASGKINTGYNCQDYGHDCPVYYSSIKSLKALILLLEELKRFSKDIRFGLRRAIGEE